MFSKIVTFGVILAAASASLVGHGNTGHAVTSQSIIRHDEARAAPVHYTAPVSQFATPAAHYAAPIAHYAAPSANYGAPAVNYGTPVVSYAPPVTNYAARTTNYAAPVTNYAAHTTNYAASAANYVAPVVRYSTPVANYHGDNKYNAHPKYNFAYSVADPHTGDHKSQQESRDGDAVHGYYTLAQPDGTVRKVEYSADGHRGFNAVVRNSGLSVHPTPVHGHAYHH